MKIFKINIKNFLTVFFSLGILLLSKNVSAQENGHNFKGKTPEQRAQLQTNMMKSKLDLDSVQTLQVNTINLKYAQKIESVVNGNSRKLAKLKQIKSIQKQKDKELKKTFNAEQYKQYSQFQEQMKERFNDGKKYRNQ